MKKLLTVIIIVFLLIPMFFLSFPKTKASSDLAPFSPHEVRVLVVSPADTYYSGAHYLVADFARYGFNITHHAANDAIATNYVTDPTTADLSQYDVVIIQGILGFSTSKVSVEEVAHFTNYGGILIMIGNALFLNETSNLWWGFDSEPVRRIEQRLGVDFTGFLGSGGAWHNNGTFKLMDSSIKGLPSSLSYVTQHYGSINFQLDLDSAPNGAREIYDFTVTSSPAPSLAGKRTLGVTYFKGVEGAIGIHVQGAYIYGVASGPSQISYFGLTDITERSSLLAPLIAYALERDFETVIKPQPLANVRLEGIGQYYSQTYLNASLSNFNSVIDMYNVTPTIGFIDYLSFRPNYWKIDVPKVLSQLKGKYRDWEYSTNLRYYTDPRLMTRQQIEFLIDAIRGNYSKLGMDLFSTVIAPSGRWNQSTLYAIAGKNLYLLDILDTDTYYSDWWNLRVNSSVIVHNSVQMLPERVVIDGVSVLAENFTQPGLDKVSINYKYFSRRHRWALATVNGFASFVYYLPNFRWNEVGTYSLQMVCSSLTSDIPDVRFVSLREAGLYFGHQWVRIKNAVRTGSVIEFDVDASAIPSLTNIGKGMVWLRINANESIQEVWIGDERWFYFDEHSIRMPAPETSVRVKVVLGALPSLRVVESEYKVLETRFDGYRFNISICSPEALNVSARLFIPRAGPFSKDNWNVFSLEAEFNYNFSAESRILTVWAISDGLVTFEVGVFWLVEHSPPWYHSNVTVKANFSALDVDIVEMILSFNLDNEWSNITTMPQGELYVAVIPVMPFGTVVHYRLYALTSFGRWFVTEVFSYEVIDEDVPEIEEVEWDPVSPVAGQPVNVRVSVSEPANASGVNNVVLYYYLGRDVSGIAQAQQIEMSEDNGAWLAEIPGQGGGAEVTFFVVAYDKAGNWIQTSHLRYAVWILPISPLLFALIVGAIVAVGVGVLLYIRRLRRIKRHVEIPKEVKQV